MLLIMNGVWVVKNNKVLKNLVIFENQEARHRSFMLVEQKRKIGFLIDGIEDNRKDYDRVMEKSQLEEVKRIELNGYQGLKEGG